MSDSAELFRELAASPVQPHPERSRGASEDVGGLVRVESLPGDELKHLPLWGAQPAERARGGVALGDRLRRIASEGPTFRAQPAHEPESPAP